MLLCLQQIQPIKGTFIYINLCAQNSILKKASTAELYNPKKIIRLKRRKYSATQKIIILGDYKDENYIGASTRT